MSAPTVAAPATPELWVEPDADGTPTVWVHNPERPDQPLALLIPRDITAKPHYLAPQDVVSAGRDAVWDLLVTALPTANPLAECQTCRDTGEVPAAGMGAIHRMDPAFDTRPCPTCPAGAA